jgi:hypothetical protein
MVKNNRTKKNIKRGGTISPLIAIPLTVAGFIAVIYFLKRTVLDVKNELVQDLNTVKDDLIQDFNTAAIDVNTMVDDKLATAQRFGNQTIKNTVPKLLQNSEEMKKLEEADDLEKRINELYNKVMGGLRSDISEIPYDRELNIKTKTNTCMNAPDRIACLNKLMTDVQRLQRDFGHRINERDIVKGKESVKKSHFWQKKKKMTQLNTNLASADDDEETKEAKLQAFIQSHAVNTGVLSKANQQTFGRTKRRRTKKGNKHKKKNKTKAKDKRLNKSKVDK